MVIKEIIRGITIVDDVDAHHLDQNWHITTKGYVARREGRKLIYLHREILGLTDPRIFTDHRNHCRFDNTRSNLRKCTPAENARNVSPRGRSRFLGVSYQTCWTTSGTYQYIKAKIRVNNHLIHVGTFNTEEEAALAYNEAAKKYFGEFANLNVVS